MYLLCIQVLLESYDIWIFSEYQWLSLFVYILSFIMVVFFRSIYLHLHTAMGLISSHKRILIKLEDISENRDNLDLQNKNTNTKQNKTEEQMFGLYKLVWSQWVWPGTRLELPFSVWTVFITKSQITSTKIYTQIHF